MPRDPNIPDAFDVYTLVLLRRPDDAPEMAEGELDALQSRHLTYRAELGKDGVLVANGPPRRAIGCFASRALHLLVRCRRGPVA